MMLKYRCQCWYSDVNFDAKIDPHFVADNNVAMKELKCVEERYLQKKLSQHCPRPNFDVDNYIEVQDVDVIAMSCCPGSDLQDIFSTMFSRRLHCGLDWWAWEDRGDPAEEVSEAQLWGGTKIQLGLSLSDFNFQI